MRMFVSLVISAMVSAEPDWVVVTTGVTEGVAAKLKEEILPLDPPLEITPPPPPDTMLTVLDTSDAGLPARSVTLYVTV